jgi:hypothetical protein
MRRAFAGSPLLPGMTGPALRAQSPWLCERNYMMKVRLR